MCDQHSLPASGGKRALVARLLDFAATPGPSNPVQPALGAVLAQLAALQSAVSALQAGPTDSGQPARSLPPPPTAAAARAAPSVPTQPLDQPPPADANPPSPGSSLDCLVVSSGTCTRAVGGDGGSVRLVAHLSESLLMKIRRGLYVEFSSLLPVSTIDGRDHPSRRVEISTDDSSDAITVATSQPARRKVDDLPSWLEAWTVFAAASTAANPQRALQLWAYQDLILSAARRYRFEAVMEYDRSFRRLAEKEPSVRWDRRDPDLYSAAFTGQGVAAAGRPAPERFVAGSGQPFRNGGAPVRRSAPGSSAAHNQRFFATPDGVPICRNYNTKGCTIAHCRFAHICFRCRGPHSCRNSVDCGSAGSVSA